MHYSRSYNMLITSNISFTDHNICCVSSKSEVSSFLCTDYYMADWHFGFLEYVLPTSKSRSMHIEKFFCQPVGFTEQDEKLRLYIIAIRPLALFCQCCIQITFNEGSTPWWTSDPNTEWFPELQMTYFMAGWSNKTRFNNILKCKC